MHLENLHIGPIGLETLQRDHQTRFMHVVSPPRLSRLSMSLYEVVLSLWIVRTSCLFTGPEGDVNNGESIMLRWVRGGALPRNRIKEDGDVTE